MSGTTSVSGGTSTVTDRLTTASLLSPSGVLVIESGGVLNLDGAGEKTINGTSY